MLRNELRPFIICLSNVGSTAITRVALSLKDPQCFVLGTPASFPSNSDLSEFFSKHLSPGPVWSRNEAERESKRLDVDGNGMVKLGPGKPPKMPFVSVLLGKKDVALEPGHVLVVPVWVRAPFATGSWASQALFSYEIGGGFVGNERR